MIGDEISDVETGANVEEIVATSFIVEDNAHQSWLAAPMGQVQYLSDEAMIEIEAEVLKSRGPLKQIWAMCEEHSHDIDP